MQMSVEALSLRKVRAMATALSAWLHDCGPTTCSVGQSTHARACAATCGRAGGGGGYYYAANVLGLSALRRRGCGEWAWRWAWRWKGREGRGGWWVGTVGTCIATSRGREEAPILVRLFPLLGGEGGRGVRAEQESEG